MANLEFFKIFFFFFLFQFFYVQLNTSAYTLPDQYFINCGSTVSSTVNGRTFVSDFNPNSFTLSATQTSTAEDYKIVSSSFYGTAIQETSSSYLYGTARIFRRASSYEFNISQNGTYVVRFHFYAFDNLFNARFDVSASKFSLLSNFHVENSNNSALIKEFFLSIDVGKFKISLIPSGSSSFAFINAIETFIAPENFIPDSATHVIHVGKSNIDYNGLLSKALQVIHRINVGGAKVTPDNDTMGRNWVPDDEYLHFPGSAKNTPFRSARPNYQPGWATESDAPDPVYNTAKEMNINFTEDNKFVNSPNENFNVSWSFHVNQNARFLVRTHFCDIISPVSTDIMKFFLYIYSDFPHLVDRNKLFPTTLSVPFYIDFVVDSDGSGFMNISIGRDPDSNNATAFLNGLEIIELIEGNEGNEGNKASKKHLFVIIGSVVGGVVLIFISVVLFWFSLRLRKAKPVETLDWQQLNLNRGSSYGRSTERNVNGTPLPDLNLGLKLAFGELLYATKNFNEELVIGEGGFGKVYRGTLRNGTKVAVKRSEPGRTQGLPEFQTEIMVLSKIRHRHLVSLIGYCDEKSEMILVYEFMEKGTLREHLYNSKEESTKETSETRLSWEKRLELCIDAARGLQYLHTGLGGPIIHRDIKSTNILLDEYYVAKVADFGISRLGPNDQSNVSTSDVKGTFGYLDPEYFRCLILTEKSDVYAFGVVLLEVLCARPAIDNFLPRDQVNLADWGMTCLKKGELEKIIDPLLVGKINPDSLRRFGEIVQKCLQDSGAHRPNMIDVLWDLEYALQLQHTPLPRQPHEDSNTDVSNNLPLPGVHRLPSYSIAITEDEMDSDTHIDRSCTSASEVFSQLRMHDAR